MSMRGGDCTRGDNAGERFVRGALSPTALRGSGAKTLGDELPVVEAREGSRQMQHDAAHRRVHRGAKLQELFTQGADLSAPERRACGVEAQLLVEDVRGGGEQTAQL